MTGFHGLLARDQDGEEHLLQVTEDRAGAGLVTISDDAMSRTMPVIVALDLAVEIIRAASRLRPGALSSTF